MNKQAERTAAFTFGIVFVIALLALAILFPEPTPFQYMVFRIVLSLAAAGVVVMVPGFLEITVPGWIRASGALGVFIVVYFYNPATLAVGPGKSPVSDPVTLQLRETEEPNFEILAPRQDSSMLIGKRFNVEGVGGSGDLKLQVRDIQTRNDFCPDARFFRMQGKKWRFSECELSTPGTYSIVVRSGDSKLETQAITVHGIK